MPFNQIDNRPVLFFSGNDRHLLLATKLPKDFTLSDTTFYRIGPKCYATKSAEENNNQSFFIKASIFLRRIRNKIIPSKLKKRIEQRNIKHSLWYYLCHTCNLVALDIDATDKQFLYGHPCVAVPDLYSPDEITHIWNQLGEKALLILEKAKKTDTQVSQWIQRDMSLISRVPSCIRLADKLSTALQSKSNRVILISDERVPPPLNLQNVTLEALRCALAGKTVILAYKADRNPQVNNLPQKLEEVGNNIFIANWQIEKKRWAHICNELSQNFSCKIISLQVALTENKDLLSIAMAHTQTSKIPDKSICFLANLLAPEIDEKQWVQNFIKKHLIIRWSLIDKLTDFFRAIVAQRPKCIIASSSPGIEMKLMLEIAQKENIPTVMFPHAALHFPNFNLMSDFNFYAVCSPFIKRIFQEKLGIANCLISSCSTFKMDNEYPIRNKPKRYKPNLPKILVLTSNSEVSYLPFFHTPTTIKLLATLWVQTQSEPNCVQMYFKGHPGHPEHCIFAQANIPTTNILYERSEIAQLFSDTDIVITVDYIGSPNEQAIRHAIPVITLIQSSNFYFHTPMMDLAQNGTGLVTDDAKKCWRLVNSLLYTKGFRETVIEKQSQWHKKHFATETPQLSKWIGEKLNTPS